MVLVVTELGVKYDATVLLLISCTIYTVCFLLCNFGKPGHKFGVAKNTRDMRRHVRHVCHLSTSWAYYTLAPAKCTCGLVLLVVL